MRNLGFNTKVKDMEGFRGMGLSVDWFVDMTKSAGDGSTSTRLDKLHYLTDGSPTLRFMLSQIRDYLLPQDSFETPRKLLIGEDTPIVAWYWEMVLNFVYVETRVLHSGLNNEDGAKLVKDFNSPTSSTRVLVLMYNVGSQGTNLDPCCSRVIMATAAVNAAFEVHLYGRPLRVCVFLDVDLNVTQLIANAYRYPKLRR